MSGVTVDIRGSETVSQAAESARRGLGNLNDEARTSEQAFKSTAIAAAAVAAAVAVMARAVGDCVTEFAEIEKATVTWNAAMKQTGRITEDGARSLRNLADEISRATGVDDELILSMQSLLATSGRTQAGIEAITRAAADMSVVTGKDLQSSVEEINKTFSGTSGRLSQLIPELKYLSEEELINGKAVDVIAEKYRGLSEQLADTADVKIKNLKNSWDDLKGAFGEFAMPTIAPVIEFFTTLINGWNDAYNAQKNYVLLSGSSETLKKLTAAKLNLEFEASRLAAMNATPAAKSGRMSPLDAAALKEQKDKIAILQATITDLNKMLRDIGLPAGELKALSASLGLGYGAGGTEGKGGGKKDEVVKAIFNDVSMPTFLSQYGYHVANLVGDAIMTPFKETFTDISEVLEKFGPKPDSMGAYKSGLQRWILLDSPAAQDAAQVIKDAIQTQAIQELKASLNMGQSIYTWENQNPGWFGQGRGREGFAPRDDFYNQVMALQEPGVYFGPQMLVDSMYRAMAKYATDVSTFTGTSADRFLPWMAASTILSGEGMEPSFYQRPTVYGTTESPWDYLAEKFNPTGYYYDEAAAGYGMRETPWEASAQQFDPKAYQRILDLIAFIEKYQPTTTFYDPLAAMETSRQRFEEAAISELKASLIIPSYGQGIGREGFAPRNDIYNQVMALQESDVYYGPQMLVDSMYRAMAEYTKITSMFTGTAEDRFLPWMKYNTIVSGEGSEPSIYQRQTNYGTTESPWEYFAEKFIPTEYFPSEGTGYGSREAPWTEAVKQFDPLEYQRIVDINQFLKDNQPPYIGPQMFVDAMYRQMADYAKTTSMFTGTAEDKFLPWMKSETIKSGEGVDPAEWFIAAESWIDSLPQVAGFFDPFAAMETSIESFQSAAMNELKSSLKTPAYGQGTRREGFSALSLDEILWQVIENSRPSLNGRETMYGTYEDPWSFAASRFNSPGYYYDEAAAGYGMREAPWEVSAQQFDPNEYRRILALQEWIEAHQPTTTFYDPVGQSGQSLVTFQEAILESIKQGLSTPVYGQGAGSKGFATRDDMTEQAIWNERPSLYGRDLSFYGTQETPWAEVSKNYLGGQFFTEPTSYGTFGERPWEQAAKDFYEGGYKVFLDTDRDYIINGFSDIIENSDEERARRDKEVYTGMNYRGIIAGAPTIPTPLYTDLDLLADAFAALRKEMPYANYGYFDPYAQSQQSKATFALAKQPNDVKGGFETILEGLGLFNTGLMDAFMSLDSVIKIVDWGGTIIAGIMDIVGPMVDKLLGPLVGILTLVGHTIGQILMPMLQGIAPVINFVVKAFIWLYNSLLPVINGIIGLSSFIWNAYAKFFNFLKNLSILGWRPFDDGSPDIETYDGWKPGELKPITAEDLNTGNGTTSGGGSGATYTKPRDLTVNVAITTAALVGENGITEFALIVGRELRSSGLLNVS